MSRNSPDRLLAELELCRHRFGPQEAARLVKILAMLARKQITGIPSLIRMHETLLFLRAFSQGPAVLRRTERLLRRFWKRVEQLRQAGSDMSALDSFEVCGIAGTRMRDTLSHDVVRWLVGHIRGHVEIDWENYEEERAWTSTWPRFMPLLEEDGNVEADVPWRRWLQTAQSSKSTSPAWLVRRF